MAQNSSCGGTELNPKKGKSVDNSAEDFVVECSKENIDGVLKLMEIHTQYIQGLSSAIMWIRNIFVIAIFAILSKVYLNQIDTKVPHINPCHGIMAVLLLTFFCYFNEGIFDLWQASHLNKMHKLDRGAKKYLFKEDEIQELRTMYSYNETAEKISESSEERSQNIIGHLRFFLCPMERPASSLFYLLTGLVAVITILLIHCLVDC